MEEFDIKQHFLVPEHIKISEEEKKILLDNYNISEKQLPMISVKDPGVKHLGVKPGDVVKIKRKDKIIAGAEYYRVVIDG